MGRRFNILFIAMLISISCNAQSTWGERMKERAHSAFSAAKPILLSGTLPLAAIRLLEACTIKTPAKPLRCAIAAYTWYRILYQRAFNDMRATGEGPNLRSKLVPLCVYAASEYALYKKSLFSTYALLGLTGFYHAICLSLYRDPDFRAMLQQTRNLHAINQALRELVANTSAG